MKFVICMDFYKRYISALSNIFCLCVIQFFKQFWDFLSLRLFIELIPRPAVAAEDPPLYLCLHLGKPLNKSVSGTAPIQAFSKMKKKPEYWFSIPREK